MTLTEWGWDAQWAAQAAALNTDVSHIARIAGQDRASWSLQTESGPESGRIPSASGMRPIPVVGDWVMATPGPMQTDPWSLQSVLTRRSQISRGIAGTGKAEQVLAANVDKIWIVHGLDSPLNPRRIERYLAVAWNTGAIPEIILAKADLLEDVTSEVAGLEPIAMGVQIRTVSAAEPGSVELLRSSLAFGCTVCLLGPSGVGKSTLVNALSGNDVAPTGEVRDKDRKGRHTTTRRELFPIPGGACLLDTPGLRELRIWTLDDGLVRAFPDIEEHARGCRFRDCRHATEPGCAVLAAVEAGSLNPARLASYRKLQAEAAYEHRKTDARARAAALSEFKAAMKSLKYHPKYKDST
jgi:ribosome biogenesis GTPase